MDQQMQNSVAVTSSGARGVMAGAWRATNGKLPAQAGALARKAMQLKEASWDDGSLFDDLPIEHPSTIAYVSICQQGNCMIYVGPQVEYLGFTQEAWLGKPDLRLQQIHKDDLERFKQALAHSRDTAEKFDCQYRIYDSAGKIHWFHDQASVVCDEAGELLFIMGAMRDITEMKVMEEELNEHRYYLEKKVEQRTEQLVRRITLLESCNASLCDKLAQARREVVTLQKQLAGAMSNVGSNDCLGHIADIGDGIRQRIDTDIKEKWIGCVASA